jgi:hypothetical protein
MAELSENLMVPFEMMVLGVPVAPHPRSSAAHTAAGRRGVDRGIPPLAVGMTDMGKKRLSQNVQNWVEARRRFHLSHAHVQMAQELGMNPKKLGGA